MTDENSPPAERQTAQRARQKTSVLLACSLLILVAAALVVLPLNRIPFPVRMLMAAIDIIAAAALWLIARQKFSGK